MQTSALTKTDKRTKHILTMAALTLIFGYISAWVLPGMVSTTGLNPVTAFSIFLGAMVAALVTAHIKLENLIVCALVGATVTSLITGLLYGVFNQPFDAVVGFVFIGAFFATIVAKRWHK